MYKLVVKRFAGRLKYASVAFAYAAMLVTSFWSPLMGGKAFANGQYSQNNQKVFVCKYVGTPGVNERLQTGQNPISVSTNAIQNYQGVGSFFSDAQGRSYVLAEDNHQPDPSVTLCPAAQGPTVVSVPAVPSTNDPCGPNNATWNKPADTNQLDWSLQNGVLKVTGKAGYVFPGNQTTYTYGTAQDGNVACFIPVQPTTPVVKDDKCGLSNDTYTIPSVLGVKYLVNNNVVSAGTRSTNGATSVTITAQAMPGYVLNGQSSWTLTFTNLSCVKEVQVTPPKVQNDPCGDKDDTYTIPAVEGVKFYINGHYVQPGTYDTYGDMNIKITAVAQPGYKIVGDDCWTLHFSDDLCIISVHAKKPTVKHDPCGTKYDSYYIPYVEGVKYYVNGHYVQPGVHFTHGATKLHITVKAAQGYKIVGDDHWTLCFDDDPCVIKVTPVTPTPPEVVCGAGNDEYTLPEVDGIDYEATWEGDTLVITATPQQGFKFPREVQTSWRYVDEATYCPAVPADPTRRVVCGPNNDVITLPETENVTYTQTGWVNGKNVVTATPDEGYYLDGVEGEVATWTFTDENTSCGQVLGETTTTPSVTTKPSAAQLENTGASLTFPMLLSTGVLGIALLTFLQSDKRGNKFASRLQRLAARFKDEFAQPFVLPVA
ncbi:hypothetical protein IPL85_01080 [Candidatus Saccharibacteria bacterium]|nr:MAG: hypothetical protein IPL85_01080 [Candidatus Saccharibacteria bacterium]